MNDKPLLDKYTRPSSGDASRHEVDMDELDDSHCFGWLRGIRDRAVSLELRKKDGFILAIGYNWISRMEYEPSRGIMLFVPGQRIIIIGSGLNTEIRPTVRLFEGITRHRVPWIREGDDSEHFSRTDEGTTIERLSWEDVVA